MRRSRIIIASAVNAHGQPLYYYRPDTGTTSLAIPGLAPLTNSPASATTTPSAPSGGYGY